MQVVVHRPGVLTIPGFLPPAECENYIARAERIGFTPAAVQTQFGQRMMTNVRNNHRCMVDDTSISEALWQRVSPYLAALPLEFPPVAVNERIRFYKYLPGQRFLGHRDGRVKVRGLISRLSFLVYLNADFEGGETTFRTLGASEAQLGVPQLPIRVVPRVGDALLFEHHHWHEGTRVTSGIKYVMRSDIFYKPNS